MSDPGDPLLRCYRELAREEPSSELDARILAAARSGVAKPKSSRWMVPVSLAAVLMLGVGVSLRMQLEQPGVEMPNASMRDAPRAAAPVAVPATAPTTAEESKPVLPAPAEPAKVEPAQVKKRAAEKDLDAMRFAPPKPAPLQEAPQANRADAAAGGARRPEPNPFEDGPVTMQPAPAAPATPPATMSAPVAAPAAEGRVAAPAAAAAAPMPGTAADAVSPRAKRESNAAMRPQMSTLGKSIAVPDPDPERELERIAKLRESGNHADADRALEQFKRDHRDFRIPEAMWERVRPR